MRAFVTLPGQRRWRIWYDRTQAGKASGSQVFSAAGAGQGPGCRRTGIGMGYETGTGVTTARQTSPACSVPCK